ncbi:Putative lysyl tRNA synthetase-like protein [Modestobacter italicus]|uniref:Lysyl tRNA synthetase-like protein n=1 Tax=Modestobacter italicus (strain DSM 44449 / CECT 9708 / BC 501) TaxID=2732864 RepID=I4F0Q1_MODI5|nr:Lsr2 family protein [Modestobacter marinus]CCH89214.1 Putative lysyl tRNA synthetase-like protein [Modestobacter marinus]
MARKTTIVLEDDLSGEVLEEGRGKTVSFALDGQSYEIDLSGDNASQLRADLRRYVDAGRKTSAPRGSASGRRTAASDPSASGRKDTGEIRSWARKSGHEVSDRGRIPSSVVEAYDAVH